MSRLQNGLLRNFASFDSERKTLKAQRPIHLPPDQNFTCTDCAKCCVTPWRVKVTSENAESIATTDAYKRLEREGFVPLPVSDGQHRIGRKEDGVCQFLRDDRSGCHIHAEAGAAAKPSVCRLYPFVLINTPDGYFVSLAFSCPAVLAGVGAPVEKQLASLSEVVKDSTYFGDDTVSPDKKVTVTENFQTSWSDYLKLEQHIVSNIGKHDPVTDLLRVTCNLVCPEPRISHLILQEAVRVFPTFAANTISVIEEPESPEARVEFASQILEGSTKSVLLDFELPVFEMRKPPSLTTSEILQRYIRNLIWGKRLVSGPTLAARLLMLATTLSILLYYVEVKKQQNGERHFSFPDLEWGFDLVEMNLFTHAEDLESVFLQYERTLFSYADVFRSNS